MAQRLSHLKTRADFLRVAGRGRKWAMPGLVLQAAPRDDLGDDIGDEVDQDGQGRAILPRLGLTTSKKVGNAVARNRARRRLKALANEVLPLYGRARLDYVLIGRPATVDRDFADLRADLLTALDRVNRERAKASKRLPNPDQGSQGKSG